MASLELAGAVKFEFTVDEVVTAARLILDATQDAKVRKALKSLTRELKKGNKALLDTVLAPLFEIQTQQDFDVKFPKVRNKFR